MNYADPKAALHHYIHEISDLYNQKKSVEQIEKAIESFPIKIPIEYKTSILIYCKSPKTEFRVSLDSLDQVAKWFLLLKQKYDPLSLIMEMENFFQSKPVLEPQQKNILQFNIAILLKQAKLPYLALKKLNDVKKICHSMHKLEAHLNLALKQSGNTTIKYPKHLQKLIQHYEIFTDLDRFKQNIHKLKSISCQELYNLSLCLKKRGELNNAIASFKKLDYYIETQSELWILSQINKAECYFMLKDYDKAIVDLQKIISFNSSYLVEYEQELMMKLEIWKKTQRAEQMIQTQKNKQLCSLKNNLYPCKQSKFFVKNKNLVFLEYKHQELMKLLKKKQANQKHYNMKPNLSEYNSLTTKSRNNNTYRKQSKQVSQLTKNNLNLGGRKKTNGGTIDRHLKKMHVMNMTINQGSKEKKNHTLNLGAKKANKQNTLNTPIIQQTNRLKSCLKQSNCFETSKSLEMLKLQSKQQDSVDSSQDESLTDEMNLIAEYQNVIRKSSSKQIKSDSYFKIGQIYDKNHRIQQAIEMYKQSIEQDNMMAYFNIGEIYLKQGNYRMATEYFSKYLEEADPFNEKIQLILMYCYSMNPETYNKAIDKLKQKLENDPGNIQAHIIYVTVLMKQKYIDKAIEMCQKFSKKYSSYQNCHLLGILYKEEGKHQRAFCSFIRAIRLNPLSIQSLTQLNQLLESKHFYEELILIYRKLLYQKQKNFIVLQIIRKIMEDKNVKKAVFKDTLTFSQLFEIGDFFIEHEMYNEAEYAYKEAARITNNSLIKEKLGNTAFFKGEYEKAQGFYEECNMRRPIFSIKCKIGHIKMKQKQFSQALKIFDVCIKKDPENKGMYFNMIGQCKYGLKKMFEAIQYFKKSKETNYNLEQNDVWIRACHKSMKSLHSIKAKLASESEDI